MKQHLLQWAAKVDALSLRERGFLFLSVLVCLIALADLVFLTPAQTRYKETQQRFATQNAEVQRLRNELQMNGKPVDLNQAVREQIAQVNEDVESTDAEIKSELASAGAGRSLEPVLVQFLRRHGNLTLLGTNTLKADTAASTATVPGLTRQGLELRIAGPYPDLVRYVQSVEAALPHLRWGTLQIKAEKQPPELSLQVYVLGVAP